MFIKSCFVRYIEEMDKSDVETKKKPQKLSLVWNGLNVRKEGLLTFFSQSLMQLFLY